MEEFGTEFFNYSNGIDQGADFSQGDGPPSLPYYPSSACAYHFIHLTTFHVNRTSTYPVFRRVRGFNLFIGHACFRPRYINPTSTFVLDLITYASKVSNTDSIILPESAFYSTSNLVGDCT